ncbi:MAG: hypothetical protein B6242_13140 [Anaerolineaceae bacterium 4572_78]|nr:MAG: hypothetical protein B6242_13140 [Anaerolineaceae bacterium 4572_78]
MAPEHREKFVDHRKLAKGKHKEGSVLLLLYPNENDELYFVLIRRSEYEGVHSGQMSLPGGKREGGESFESTALRETHEEIGTLPEHVNILGSLSPLYIPPSNFMVYPFVGYFSFRPKFILDENEVAALIEVPLSLLMDSTNRHQTIMAHPHLGLTNIPYFDIFGNKVWGATAMILAEFIELY